MLNWIKDVTSILLFKLLFLCLVFSLRSCVGVSAALSLRLRQIRLLLPPSTAKQQKSISRGNINKRRIGKEENDWMFSSDVSVALIHPDMRDMLPLGRLADSCCYLAQLRILWTGKRHSARRIALSQCTLFFRGRDRGQGTLRNQMLQLTKHHAETEALQSTGRTLSSADVLLPRSPISSYISSALQFSSRPTLRN